MNIATQEKTQNSTKKLNLLGANSPPVAPSDVKKCLIYVIFLLFGPLYCPKHEMILKRLVGGLKIYKSPNTKADKKGRLCPASVMSHTVTF